MNYSILYLNEKGVTKRSKVSRFESDHEAVAYARKELSSNAIVEVWKGNHLVTRLFQKRARTGVYLDTDAAD